MEENVVNLWFEGVVVYMEMPNKRIFHLLAR